MRSARNRPGNFNPLRREGGDELYCRPAGMEHEISIHSAARAETQEPQGLYCRPADFNPLRREGGDGGFCKGDMEGKRFQSTPPRGRRPTGLDQILFILQDFNPLRREGGDVKVKVMNRLYQIFQSTPPRGRRRPFRRYTLLRWIFQSTPPRGRRRMGTGTSVRQPEISIHSAARAETSNGKDIKEPAKISIHSAARAETDATYNKYNVVYYISIHSAARAETTYANDHVLPCNISIHSAARAETSLLNTRR